MPWSAAWKMILMPGYAVGYRWIDLCGPLSSVHALKTLCLLRGLLN